MALLYKPHTLTFAAVTEETNAEDEVQLPEAGTGVEIDGQLTPMTSQAAFERFGVELARPHLWMCDDDDPNIAKLKVGAQAAYGSRVLEQKSPLMIWDAIPVLSCAECVLEEREFV